MRKSCPARCKRFWTVPDATRDIPNDWPNRALSRKVRGPRHDWHVQEAGSGPDVLLLHGAGGSVHSFAELIPLLAKHARVFAPDLPGHGFTRLGAQRRSGLAPMAEDIAVLCNQENISPKAIIGHSAGAAIALELAHSRPDCRVVGINPALSPFEGIAGLLFPAAAKLLAAVPFTSKLFSGASASPVRIKALIDSTGSKLSPEGLDRYRQLVSMERHVSGTLSMMAQWDLDALLAALPDIQNPARFIVGAYDMTVPNKVATTAAQRMPNAEVISLPSSGHLVHEEQPEQVADLCVDFLRLE